MNTYKKLGFGLLLTLLASLTVVFGPKALHSGLLPTVSAAPADHISLTAPKDGATVNGSLTVSVNASAAVGIEGVETRVNDSTNSVIGGATSQNWVKGAGPKSWSGSGTWDTSSLPDGQYTITAILHKADGTASTDAATVTTNNGNTTTAGGPATLADLINCNKTFQWQDYAHISCLLSAQRKVVFTDSNPDQDDGHGHYIFAPPSDIFCGPDPTETNTYGIGDEGLVVQPNNNWSVINFNEGYLSRGVSGCQSFWDGYLNGHGGDGHGNDNAPIQASAHTIPRSPNRSSIVLAGTSDGAQTLPGVTDGKFSGYSFVRWKSDYDPSGNVFLFGQNIALDKLGSDCTGDILAVTADGNGNSAGAHEYTLGPSGDPLSKYSDLKNLPSAPNCRVSAYNFGSGDINQYPEQIYLDPQILNLAKIGAGDVTQGGNPSDANKPIGTCESNLNSSFSWIICPVLDLSDDIIGGIYSQVEGQLCFNINAGSSSTTGNVVCQGSPNTIVDGIQSAWSIFKNIASALLVIVMLVMVFSQAVGGGPFDAYAVRKTLPKLVAAVILMQLSYVLLKWTIDLSNDAGSAIGNLIMAPFGGPGHMSLGSMVGHGVTVATGGNGVGNGAFQFFTIIAGLAAFIWAIPALPLLAFYVIIGVLIAFFVLIIRKLLIIMLVMLAPLALIAWVLPGTENYWKLWRTNLTKLLAMFPLIMAMLASGRVLAYITSQAGNSSSLFNPRLAVAHLGPLPVPYFASVTGFGDLAIVVGAFFAPYFLIPKTFNWGGSLMSSAGGAVNKIGEAVRKKGEEPIRGFGERQFRGWAAKKYKPKGSPGSNIFNRTGASLLGGRVIPTRYQAALLTQKGDKWNEERDAEALALLKRKGESARDGYETAVLTDDKTSFAKWREDAAGNRLDEHGNILYHKQANGTYLDRAGNEVDKMGDEVKERVDSYDAASKRILKGTQAMKQMWVDIADQSNNKHEKKMAIRQLIATASWPEIQGSISRGGNKVIDTDDWANSINTSPEDYPKVLRSRVDAAPHVDEIAKQKLVEAKAKDPAKAWTKQQEKDFISQQRVLYSIKSQMSNEDFQTQSEGYWEEVARVANLKDGDGNFTQEAVDIQKALKDRLTAISQIGGTAPQQLLGHLVGGSVEDRLDEALAGTGTTIRQYVGSKQKPPPTTTARPPGPTLTRQDIQTMSDDEALDWIYGGDGLSAKSDQDLTTFYNSRRGGPQKVARDELVRRGALNPQGPNLPGSTVTPSPQTTNPDDNEFIIPHIP